MHHAINEYQLRLDVQRFLWPAYYLFILYYTGPVASCVTMQAKADIVSNPDLLSGDKTKADTACAGSPHKY